MGEQPVFTTRAHVFQINPTTKKSWIPCCGQPVPVSFYYDPSRQTHRIICVDGSKALVNSTITANMTFTKTSQKFGQWSDPKANTIFGLGFAGEADITKFEEKFKEAKAAARLHSTYSSISSVASSPQSPNRPGPATVNNHIPTSKSLNSSISESGMSTPPSSHRSAGRSNSSTSSQEDGGSPISPRKQTTVNSIDSQLKYENDKLKAALAQSSTNAKKWEAELQTLKNNNARLTAALQESTSNVEEWKKQLNAYKEENTRLRDKVHDLEHTRVSDDQLNKSKQEKDELVTKVEELENLLRDKDQEINKLSQQQLEINNLKMKIADLSMQQQETENERQKLQEKNDDLQIKLEAAHMQYDKVAQLQGIQEQVGQKITELHHLHEQMVDKLQT